MRSLKGAPTSRQGLSKRIITGFVALSSAAVVGTVGMAGATPKMNNPDNNQARKDFCKSWQAKKFKNHGECEKDWNHKHHHVGYNGHGHGDGHDDHASHNNVKNNVGIDVKGDHSSVVVNIWNYFFG